MVPPSRRRKTPGTRMIARPAGLFVALLSAALALAAPARASDPDWSKAETVTMTMSEYQFSPNALTFKRGVAYRLHLVNKGKELHELDGPRFYAAISVGNPEILVNGGMEVDVKPGQSQDFLFVPLQAGQYPFDCDDHEEFGMTGVFTVE